jgi:hypothetical protein
MRDDEKNSILSLLLMLHDKADETRKDLCEVKERQAKMEGSFETHMQQDEQMQVKLGDYNKSLAEYNGQLQIHIAGVQELKRSNDIAEASRKQQFDDIEKRITSIEAPRKIAAVIRKNVVDIAKFIAAVGVIAGVIKHWFPHI